MRRRALQSAISLLLVLVLLTGCTDPSGKGTAPSQVSSPVNLIYYTIGEPDADLELVNEALNELLLERYGFTVTYQKIGWNEYSAHLNSLLGTGENFDIAFSWTENYVNGVKSHAWLDLTDYLKVDGKTLYNAVNEGFWKGITVDGRIWGIPTNKELATPVHFLFSQELVEKHNIDITKYKTLGSLEPLLEEIRMKEPDYIPLFLDSQPINLLTLDGYSYVAYDTVPLMVRTDDSSCRVINIFETQEAMDYLVTLHRYFLAGYINLDASLRSSFSRFQDEKVFLRLSMGGPDASASYSTDYGYPIIAQQASDSIVTTQSTQGGIMVINANTRYPKECMTFLMAVNTDPDIRNLLNYGIEGTHYTLTNNDQVKIISDRYRGVPYTQGNWFILKTAVGEKSNKWDLYRQFNSRTEESPLLGFTPDYSKCADEFNMVSRVYDKYYSSLLTGTVDPVVYLPMFLQELEAAGIQKLQQCLQEQIDQWRSQQ